MTETAYFATGCFWGAERRFWQLDGVIETAVGYMGGDKENPTYKEVCTDTTGHAEMVKVVFCVVVSVLTQFDGQQYYVCKTNNASVGKVYTPIHYEVGDTIWIECR